jgi:hypothetical protein
MLQAELAGHALSEALGSEDYLTSTVFGLLKYVDGQSFWDNLFHRAVSVGANTEWTLGKLCVAGYGQSTAVEISFWQKYEDGVPDLTVRFIRDGKLLIRILIEVKLHAGKGEAGDEELDQLVRYARLAEKLSTKDAPTILLFLTPGDPVPDIQESVNLLQNKPSAASRIYGLQWGDVHAACLDTCRSNLATRMEQQLLGEVAAYLQKRNFDFFSGFHRIPFQEFKPQSLFPCTAEALLRQIPLPRIAEVKRIIEDVCE